MDHPRAPRGPGPSPGDRKSLIFEDNTILGVFLGVVERRRGPPPGPQGPRGARKPLNYDDNTVSGDFFGVVEGRRGPPPGPPGAPGHPRATGNH